MLAKAARWRANAFTDFWAEGRRQEEGSEGGMEAGNRLTVSIGTGGKIGFGRRCRRIATIS